MTSRRIRVLTYPPLPLCRIWLLIPPDATTINTVKESICRELVFKGISVPSHESLTLQMDDFELPDRASNELIRDGDTVAFKYNGTSLPTLKRDADAVESSTHVKRRRTSTDSSVSSTDTTTTSSSSSSESSSSDSDSDSNAPSSSRNISAPSDARFRAPRFPGQHATRPQTVPPGMGKNSTHARNSRRRIKRKFSTVQLMPLVDVLHNNAMQDHQSEPSKQLDYDTKKVMPFVPPSQRIQIPSNLFITRVNVGRPSYGSFPDEENNMDEPETHHSLDQGDSLDWDEIEMHWGRQKKIEESDILKPGSLVAWKAFGLDPLTLTPQMSVLHIATIESVVSDHVTVILLKRPVKGGTRFGMTLLEDEAGEQLNFALADTYSSDWRLLSSPLTI